MEFLEINRGRAPLVIAMPHTGTEIPPDLEGRFTSPWLARKDTDWWVDRLYAFAASLGATTVRTRLSRSIIDVNRDPSGASLYPGQTTTELCPLATFDGEPLYRPGQQPDDSEIARRRGAWFQPYHAALRSELERARAGRDRVVLYDAHSIRSVAPRLFAGELPQFNIGSNDGASCDPALAAAVEAACALSGRSWVANGRFKGGWTTRHWGDPGAGVHAIQMELACRGYMDEPASVREGTWPTGYSDERAAPLIETLVRVIEACLAFAVGRKDVL